MGGRELLFIGFKKFDKFVYIGVFFLVLGFFLDSVLNYLG